MSNDKPTQATNEEGMSNQESKDYCQNNPAPNVYTGEATNEELQLELEKERVKNELLRQKEKHMEALIKKIELVHGFFDYLSGPHYLTSKDLHTYKDKGIELLLTHWRAEINQKDKEMAEKYKKRYGEDFIAIFDKTPND